MPSRTPEQKLAREIQKATGRRYTDCLREARERLANPQAEEAPPGT